MREKDRKRDAPSGEFCPTGPRLLERNGQVELADLGDASVSSKGGGGREGEEDEGQPGSEDEALEGHG